MSTGRRLPIPKPRQPNMSNCIQESPQTLVHFARCLSRKRFIYFGLSLTYIFHSFHWCAPVSETRRLLLHLSSPLARKVEFLLISLFPVLSLSRFLSYLKPVDTNKYSFALTLAGSLHCRKISHKAAVSILSYVCSPCISVFN